MKRTLITVVVTAIATIALIGLALVAIAQSGAVDVAADADYAPGVARFLSTLSDRSVERHSEAAVEAGEIVKPDEVTDAMLRTGAAHYAEMCAECHGAPGVDRGEIGSGLKPRGPGLAHSAREMDEAEIYWIVDHGIRHTGMPGFGKTHSDAELWAITSFVERLADMDAAEYRRWTASAADSHEHADGHEHGDEHAAPEDEGDEHAHHDHEH